MSTIVQEFVRKHPKSAEAYQRSKTIFPGGVTHDTRYLTPFPLFITHASGSRKWDLDGNEYVDYVMGHGALILGHAHPSLVQAVTEQIRKGTHLGGNTLEEIRWAEAIRRLIPSAQKVRFHSSGTEATMMAVRLARAYTGKKRLIKFADHFHGWSDALLPSAGTAPGGIPEETWATVTVLPPNDLALVEKTIREKGDVAAVILEPTGAHMGQYPVRPDFLRGLREVTTRYGVVLIFDEVVTGFRTAKNGAQGRFGVLPDLTTLAKIVAGGLPGAAVVGKAEILDMIQHRGDPDWDTRQRVGHPGTFNANPLSAVAGATCLELLASQPINEHAERMAERLKRGIRALLQRMEVPGCAFGVGALVELTLGVPHDCPGDFCPLPLDQVKQATRPALRQALRRAMLNNGADLMGGGRFILSGVHTEQDIEITLDALERSLRALRAEGLV
ncbi:MAG: aspartate aminotransferase family protein [Dehalococcoidia bacterium]|nr:aspartate aminotransferase family protein [Dehalococcoidia bacterium]MDW8119172.1 aspartate aminotransferase family protein [Chloroflexota bacterium]